MIFHTFYTYDSKGNKTGVEIHKWGDVLKEKYSFAYDEYSNLIEEQKIYGDEEGVEKRLYVYNEESQMIKESHFNLRGEKNREFVYTYDERGNMILKDEIVSPIVNVEFSKEIYEFDDKNRKTEKQNSLK